MKLTPRMRELLEGLEIENNRVKRINEELDRTTYLAIDSIFKSYLGLWSTKEQAHIFPII